MVQFAVCRLSILIFCPIHYRAAILEQLIVESRQQQQIAEQSHQNAIEQLTVLQKGNLTLQNKQYELQELLNLFEEENQKLNKQLINLKETNPEIQQLKDENSKLNNNLYEALAKCKNQEEKIDRLQYRLDALKHQLAKHSNYDVSIIRRNHNTVYELLLEVEEQYDDILQIWDSAKKSAKVLKVKPSNDVYIAFEVLAHTGQVYFNLLSDGESMGSWFWDQAFRDRELPNVYRPDESEATMNKYGKDRIFTHGLITQHLTLKLGSDHYFQIYFKVNRDEKKIDIGYCGKHLSIVSYS